MTRQVTSQPLLSVRELVKEFRIPGRRAGDGDGWVQAVRGVSFDLAEGETLGLVGESGCGKSTIGRCVLRLVEPTEGTVTYKGGDVLGANRAELRAVRREVQIMFQDSSAALDPRMTVSRIVAEPLVIHGTRRREALAQVGGLLAQVGLSDELGGRYQHQLSGGQRQRVGLARALALGPKVVILDEPVSQLDVSVQAGVLDLLARVREQRSLAYLFISHDLAVVSQMADRVAIMHLGTIVETGSRADIFERPVHPYTQALIVAAPVAEPPDPSRPRSRQVLPGEHPSAVTPPSGCGFRTRCWKATELCADQTPELVARGDGHLVACHHPDVASPDLLVED